MVLAREQNSFPPRVRVWSEQTGATSFSSLFVSVDSIVQSEPMKVIRGLLIIFSLETLLAVAVVTGRGVPGLLGQILIEGRGHHKDSDLHNNHGRKRLCLALGGIVQKSIGGNKPALPQSFELPSPAEEYKTFDEHRSGRYAPDLRISRRKFTSRRKIV
ncbi:hypothetical protein TNCV_4675551 [Trichonephila clavipes]|nr:hypothetical protein TNCV_4675551 [Trichonephila clavipes]